MPESRSVCLFGYSGHAYVVIESLMAAGYEIKGYFDIVQAKNNPYQLAYLGDEKQVDIKAIVKDQLVFPCVGDNSVRKRLIELFDKQQLKQFVAIDPSALVSPTASIQPSTYIGKGVALNAQAVIGKGVILNTLSIVEHECNIGNYVHIAPSAVLCGNVSVGENSFIGSNAVVRQNIRISAGNLIGAGSVVTANIEENGVWVGNKLRKL